MNTLSAHPVTSTHRTDTQSANTLFIYYLHLLRRGLRSAAIWAGAVAAYALVMIVSFPSLTDSMSVEVYPEALRRAFGMNDLATINGFLSLEVFSLMPIALAIYPLIALAGSIAGAEERGRLDVLLGTPLSRRDLLIAHFAATASLLAGIVIVLGTVGWLTGLATDVDLAAADIFGAALALWPIALFFGAVALLVSSGTRRFAVAAGIAMGVLIAMYGLDTIGKLAENDAVRSLSAFRYYGDPMQQGVDWLGAIGLIIASIVLAVVALIRFERRDIYT